MSHPAGGLWGATRGSHLPRLLPALAAVAGKGGYDQDQAFLREWRALTNGQLFRMTGDCKHSGAT